MQYPCTTEVIISTNQTTEFQQNTKTLQIFYDIRVYKARSSLAHLIYSKHCICSETNIGNVKSELNKQCKKSNKEAGA